MTSLRTLIIDDEPHAIEVIKKYAAQIPEIQLQGTYANAVTAFQELRKNETDLIFLDINMPGLSGTELVRSLQNPPLVIFTTAHQEHAVEGFELNAVDYLLKPISFDRFLRAVDKVMNLHKLQSITQPVTSPATTATAQPFYLYVRIDRQLIKLDTEEICWIESDKDYIKIFTPTQTYMTKQKISAMENLLPIQAFLRVHRSFIVPLNKVTGYNPNYLMVNNTKIPIGRNYKQICLDKFNPGNQSAPVFID
ncbi:LytR/AlgR family response regulator transcription factor [Terrimonas ferruginea]|uniref:LytR/AlgR family response regulator transcription factor n=1 Tax=Terrimonas ferruginea TaxID=249 RepID=UPI00040FB51F|nr:LytTR family DNA-binding domain-containing protein [Terrimonas ferruginea]